MTAYSKRYYSSLFRYVRRTKQLSQRALAKKMHVSHSTIGRIEKGLHHPKPSLVSKLEQVSGLSLKELAAQASHLRLHIN